MKNLAILSVVVLLSFSISSCEKNEEPQAPYNVINSTGTMIEASNNDSSNFRLHMSYKNNSSDSLPILFYGVQTEYLSSTRVDFKLNQLHIGDFKIGAGASLHYYDGDLIGKPTEFDATEGTISINHISADGKVSGTYSVSNTETFLLFKTLRYTVTGSFTDISH